MSVEAFSRLEIAGLTQSNSGKTVWRLREMPRVAGYTILQFTIEGVPYEAPAMVGKLSGVDLLLGMDRLVRSRAKINFETLKLNWHLAT